MSDEIDVETRLPDTLNPWEGKHAEFFADATPEIEIEGSRMCAKTTVCLDKEIHFLQKYPGIHSFMCRYSDIATNTKLKPRFETLCAIRGFVHSRWDAKELCYVFPNDSKMYAFGIKAASAVARYEKIRGLDVARVYVDQAEEVPKDLGEELRASLRQKGYPRQITFSPNPVPRNHWLAQKKHGGFPLDNSVSGRRHYKLSLYDNRYNLDEAAIENMERTYPPDHAKHGAMIQGIRGPNVRGKAVFEKTFKRSAHVRPIAFDPNAELYESFEFGKHRPCVVYAQRPYAGGLVLLAGVMADDMFLEDFLPIVEQYRSKWFPKLHPKQRRTCCTPTGAIATTGSRFTSLQVLRMAKYQPVFRDGAGAHDVQLALIEQLAGYMRRRDHSNEEKFGINSDASKWISISDEGPETNPFMAHACEASAVWSEHMARVGNQEVRQVEEDDEYANALHAVQSIEVNFCADKPTQSERDKRVAESRRRNGDSQDSQVFSSPNSWLL